MVQAKIGIIGGSGLYRMQGLADVQEVHVETPYGVPSDHFTIGNLEGSSVAFLPRHGRGHRFSPTEIPVRANIFAFKKLGVELVISISAVGSLKKEIKPLDILVPDQLIDRTRHRASTFFEDGIAAHVAFSDPYCPALSLEIEKAAVSQPVDTHIGGTYVVIEGPQFSTRAESELYRSWGASVIGMTALPEAKLAREAQMCYATLALVTDYDCWYEAEEEVSVGLVVANMQKNVAVSQDVIRAVVPTIPRQRDCLCSTALANAIITDLEQVHEETRQRLSVIMGDLG
ncbi:MAG: S-methyl-5'-thioadenosine phosphorylase [SAR202 cluster bacterium]|nr:S-methyl-5'-thioadenosine phosphorylase [SAR202 cluster bacterium]